MQNNSKTPTTNDNDTIIKSFLDTNFNKDFKKYVLAGLQKDTNSTPSENDNNLIIKRFFDKIIAICYTANPEERTTLLQNLKRFLHTYFTQDFKQHVLAELQKHTSSTPSEQLNNLASQLEAQPDNIKPIKQDTTNNPQPNAKNYSDTTTDIIKEITEALNTLQNNDIKRNLIESISSILKVVGATKVQTHQLNPQELKVLSLELNEFNNFLSTNNISAHKLCAMLRDTTVTQDTLKELQDAVNYFTIKSAPSRP